MIDLHKLEIFALVVREGSFSAAADRLLMTQSGVSQHMQDLETHFGAKLFDRNRRGVTLTPAGAMLDRYARSILRLVSEAESAITDVENLSQGQLTIGATPGIGVYLLPEWVQTFRVRYAQLAVTVQTGVTAQIIALLRGQQIDFGLVEGEIEGQLNSELKVLPLVDVPQYIVVGKKHPWWGLQSVPIAALDAQPMIMRQANSQTRRWLDEILTRHGAKPQVNAEFDNVESIKRSVMQGACAAVLPEYDIATERDLGLLWLIVPENAQLTRTMKLLWSADRFISPVARAFLRQLSGQYPVLKNVVGSS